MLRLAPCRNGEESRAYLIQLSEKYLEQHALDGYVPSTSNREVVLLRPSVEAGKFWTPVCLGLSRATTVPQLLDCPARSIRGQIGQGSDQLSQLAYLWIVHLRVSANGSIREPRRLRRLRGLQLSTAGMAWTCASTLHALLRRLSCCGPHAGCPACSAGPLHACSAAPLHGPPLP